MADQEIEKKLREKILMLPELTGNNIAHAVLSIYKDFAENTIEERLDIISVLWNHIEKILDTSDREKLHPYLKTQRDPEQSKKGFLGNAWEQIFESLANDFLQTLCVKVIRLSRENIEKFITENIKLDNLENRFNEFKKLGLIEETRFSKGRLVNFFYTDIISQLQVYIDDNYEVLVNPDCDLIIIKYINDGTYTGKMLVLAVLSSKKKFRERIAQVGYWTVKFRHSGSKVKNLLITPDEDKDFLKDSDHKKIAEIDTDGTYVVYPEEINSTKIKHLKFLKEDVKKIIDERHKEIEMYEKYGSIIDKLLTNL